MRTFIFFASFTMVLLSVNAARAESPVYEAAAAERKDTPAQQAYQGAAVVVVDARYILAHDAPLKTKLLAWNEKLLEVQKRHQDEQEKIAQLKQRFHDLVVDSPQYLEDEKELFHKELESALNLKAQQRRLLRARAKLFSEAYCLIRVEIAEFMKENRIALVLNFDGNPFPSTPLTLAKLTDDALPSWGASGSFTLNSVWSIPERAAEPDDYGDTEEDLSSALPQRVEQALRDGTLGVNQDHDVTPLILERLRKRAQAEPAKDNSASAEQQATDKVSAAKKTAASRPPTLRVGRRSRTRR